MSQSNLIQVNLEDDVLQDYHVSLSALLSISESFQSNGLFIDFGIRCGSELYSNDWNVYISNPNFETMSILLNNIISFNNQISSVYPNMSINAPLWYSRHVLLNISYNEELNNIINTIIEDNKYNYTINNIDYFLKPSWDIHFISVQRRYNNSRYGSARVISSPSFMAGALSCCISIGMFWGASLQNLDWVTTQPLLINPWPILILIIFWLLLRLILVTGEYSNVSTRDRNNVNNGRLAVIRKFIVRHVNWW